ncbi:hypothetical protein IID22_02610 [Patescibacteria group bacterium]|nr:hypothetical protein [Patescibacteria group bacterium]
MPEESKDILKKYKDKINFLILIIFVLFLGSFFWNNIRPKIIISSCTEIALNTSHIQARTSVFIDTTQAYDLAFNECVYQAGVDPLAE